MKTIIYLTVFVGTFSSCSSIEDRSGRIPSSLNIKKRSCSQAISAFTSSSQKTFSTEDLSKRGIDLSTVKADENFKDLASVNGNKETQEKTFYILALLKKKNPHDSSDEIILRYSNMLKDCS